MWQQMPGLDTSGISMMAVLGKHTTSLHVLGFHAFVGLLKKLVNMSDRQIAEDYPTSGLSLQNPGADVLGLSFRCLDLLDHNRA